jgi:type IV pilus assembly protein PilC
MPYYEYKGLSLSGKKTSGFISADNDQDLLLQLKNMYVRVTEYKVKSESVLRKYLNLFLARKLKTNDLIYFFSYINQLLVAGIQVTEGLRSLYSETRNLQLKQLSYRLYTLVQSGRSFSEALSFYPKYFPEIFIGLIKAGEANDSLSSSLEHITEYIKMSASLKSKVIRSLAYPALMLVICCAMVVGATHFTIPKIMDFLQQGGDANLPVYTRALLAFSTFMQAYALKIGIGISFTFASVVLLYHFFKPVKLLIHNLILRLPFFGELAKKSQITRFANFYSITYLNNANAFDALSSSVSVISNAKMRREILLVRSKILNGEEFSAAFLQMGTLPQFALRMFRVSASSGNITECMDNIVYFYKKDIEQNIEALISSLKPSLIIFIGGFMMWIMASVMIPLYSKMSSLGGMM